LAWTLVFLAIHAVLSSEEALAMGCVEALVLIRRVADDLNLLSFI